MTEPLALGDEPAGDQWRGEGRLGLGEAAGHLDPDTPGRVDVGQCLDSSGVGLFGAPVPDWVPGVGQAVHGRGPLFGAGGLEAHEGRVRRGALGHDDPLGLVVVAPVGGIVARHQAHDVGEEAADGRNIWHLDAEVCRAAGHPAS